MKELNQAVLSWMEAHRDEYLSDLRELAQIPAPSHYEDQRAAWVKAWLERHKPNLSRPSTGNDHTSTVPAASEQPPAPDAEDGTENIKPDTEAIKPSVPAFSMPSCPEGTPVDQLLKRLELIKPIR